MSIITGKGGFIRSRKVSGFDPDALDFITRVEAVEGALEPAVKAAWNKFIVDCKNDPSPFAGVSNYRAIKSCCLPGAKTLSGFLVNLKPEASTITNINFINDDWNRYRIKGNGTNKALNSNRRCDEDPQDNCHLAIWITEPTQSVNIQIGARTLADTNQDKLMFSNEFRLNNGVLTSVGLVEVVGFRGASRINSNSYSYIHGVDDVGVINRTSSAPSSLSMYVMARNLDNNINMPTDIGLSYFSIGEGVNLETLKNRTATLIADITAALS